MLPLLPLVVWISVAVVSLLMGTTIVLKWDEIVTALKGKRLAVLGDRKVGKTHLIKFLATGSIPLKYEQTLDPDKVSGRRFQLKELDLKIKDMLDVSGNKLAYNEWKKLHDEADIVFYLLRADHLIAGDVSVEGRVREDLRQIGGWLEARTPRSPFFIIGTFCDFDAEFTKLSADKIGDYVDKFRRLPIIMELVARAGGTQQSKVVLGSMKTIPDTEALVYQIFRQVSP